MASLNVTVIEGSELANGSGEAAEPDKKEECQTGKRWEAKKENEKLRKVDSSGSSDPSHPTWAN